MKNIQTILIANRGEIASRIIRTCRKMGIRSVAVYSDADRDAPYVEAADMAVYIGESNPAASYLDQDKIIDVAKKVQADAIHPGYGFLSENVNFAKRCKKENIIFIGPHPEAIASMGSKSLAKSLMKKHHVPIVPGYQGKDQSMETLTKVAIELGFPVLLKATAGGGGKGMRIVQKKSEIEHAIQAAKREATNAFGDDELIIEKYIESGRHIEFQIFGDQHGNVIHLLERECSIQRRYQKVMEESPSPVMDKALRERMGKAAVDVAKALHYDNAGTVEFIYDDKTKDFYFLEVNTRLQVEHPVTEEITGLDLVQMQIESAQGLPLAIEQKDVQGKGYAIELRLYAEDAANDFLPVTGSIEKFEVPEVKGLRVETAIRTNSEISIFYDPMIAKLIVWDENRGAAHRKMQYVLQHLVCLGMTTNQDLLWVLMKNPDLQKGNYNTHFIKDKIDLQQISVRENTSIHQVAIASTLFDWQKRENARTLLRSLPSGWRSSFYDFQQETYKYGETDIFVKYRYQDKRLVFLIDEKKYAISLHSSNEEKMKIEIDGILFTFSVIKKDKQFFVHNEHFGNIMLLQKDRFPIKEVVKEKGGYEAPMPSQVVKILVENGQQVKTGDNLIVLSSMKMENTICSDEDGIVEEIFTTEGANVEAGFLLLKLS